MILRPACSALLALGFLAAPAAHAQTDIEIGTLECTGGAGVGLILGSKKSYSCTFKGLNGARESYEATITRVGLDIGVTGNSVLVWTVLAATNAYEPRALVGNYVGATADASVGVGGGAKVLVGGSKNNFALQPVSVQGQTGLNLAVGVAELQVR